MNAPTLSAMGFEFPASGSRTFQDAAVAAALPTDDHLQRLAQMTQGVGHTNSSSTTTIKSSGSSDSSDPNSTITQPDPTLYQSAAAAAYVQQYGNWPNYYQQFGQPMNPAAAAFSAWPAQCYAPPHWPNYAQSKKGRQTYQRYQTSVLESKFQQSSYVSKKQREELRLQTNLSDRQIKIWFQNRRMKAKKEKNRCEEQNDHSALLPANPPKQLVVDSATAVAAAAAAAAVAEDRVDKKITAGAGWCMPAMPTMPQPWPNQVPPHPASYVPYPICPPNI
ncbi:homeobox domain protein [Onchocerca flexuosa]|uniref:Homeobox domain protein n=1 Tax=Onchocerca flexuosa TaxID=387005 RepID=A0A238BNM1_9BILA|nr:homeobox domain protein [Onchocerca flexuosa]